MNRNAIARICILSYVSIALISCSHLQRSNVANSETSGAAAPVVGEAVKGDGAGTPNDLDDTGKDLSAVPIEVNRLVLEWIDYFQGRGREHMERYLARGSKYIPMMKEILRREGLPEDLVYIALIESGFSSSAKSTATRLPSTICT